MVTHLVLTFLESIVALYQSWGPKVYLRPARGKGKQAGEPQVYQLPCRMLTRPWRSFVGLWLLLLLRMALLASAAAMYLTPTLPLFLSSLEEYAHVLGVSTSLDIRAMIGTLYMSIYIIYEAVRNLPCGHVWWLGVTDSLFSNPDLDRYFSRWHLRSSASQYWWNGLQWLCIMALKISFESKMMWDIYPRLKDLWLTDSGPSYSFIRFGVGRDGINVLLSLVLAFPYLVMCVYDSGLFYQLVSSVAGTFYAYAMLKLGHVRDWKLLVTGFTCVPEQWWDKGMSETARKMWKRTHEAPNRIHIDDDGLHVQPWCASPRKGDQSPGVPSSPKHATAHKRHTQPLHDEDDPWGAFESVWAEIVEELRERDLLSDKEKKGLVFVDINQKLKAVQEVDPKEQISAKVSRFARPSVLLPRFVCCDQIRRLVDVPNLVSDHQVKVLMTAARALLWVLSQGGYITDGEARLLMGMNLQRVSKPSELLREILDVMECLNAKHEEYSPVASMVLPGEAGMSHFKKVTMGVFGGLFKIATLLQDSKEVDVESGGKGGPETLVARLKRRFEDAFNIANSWTITSTTEEPLGALGTVRRHHRMCVNTWRASAIHEMVTWLHDVLSKDAQDLEPVVDEAKESLQWFATTLYNPDLKHKDLPTVQDMLTLTTLTPHYMEDVIYGLNLEDIKQTMGVTSYETNEYDKSFLFLNSGEANDHSKYWKYLKTVYPREWDNFLERVHGLVKKDDLKRVQTLPCKLDESFFLPHGPLHDYRHHLLLWASNRGQLLSRTTRGMMLYTRALKVLAMMELGPHDQKSLEDLVERRYNYIISSQVYGENLSGKKGLRGQWLAYGLNFLLGSFPKLKVAYIDSVDQVKMTVADFDFKIKEQYSVLIQADPQLLPACPSFNQPIATRELYRVRLPVNYEDSLRVPGTYGGAHGIILGEGKPENQNHATIFCHGELLQTIDMNQDNHLAEAFKIKNLTQEFVRHEPPARGRAQAGKSPGPSTPSDPSRYTPTYLPFRREIALVGFRERIFSGDSGALAQYAAATELTFGSVVQRMMDKPGAARFHYGHPDVWNKKFIMTRGGVSKANCQQHVSEDVFGGYNASLRGGLIKYVEYITVGKGRDMGFDSVLGFEAKVAAGNGEQVMSREVYRLATRMDFFRLMSWYVTGNGFFINNFIVMFSIHLNVWVTLVLVLAGQPMGKNIAASGGVQVMQLGLISLLVYWLSLWLETGIYNALMILGRQIFSGSFLFNIFRSNTSAQFFSRDVAFGGAGYIATGRGYTLEPSPFTVVYMKYARTHLYIGIDLLILLILVAIMAPLHVNTNLWASWLVVLSLLLAPFWFNPFAFCTSRLKVDTHQFKEWLGDHMACGSPSKTWSAWNKDHLAKPRDAQRQQTGRTWTCLFNIMSQLPSVLLALTAVNAIEVDDNTGMRHWQVFTWATLGIWTFVVLTYAGRYYHHQQRLSIWFRTLKDLVLLLSVSAAIFFIIFYGITFKAVLLVIYANFQVARLVISSMLFLPFGQKGLGRRFVDLGFWVADCTLGYTLLCLLYIMSPLGIATKFQGWLLFNTDFSKQVVSEEEYQGTKYERQLRSNIETTEKIIRQMRRSSNLESHRELRE